MKNKTATRRIEKLLTLSNNLAIVSNFAPAKKRVTSKRSTKRRSDLKLPTLKPVFFRG